MIKNHNINNADICELAHTLTVRECEQRKLKIDAKPRKEVAYLNDIVYSNKAQEIFNYYYDTITNTLNI